MAAQMRAPLIFSALALGTRATAFEDRAFTNGAFKLDLREMIAVSEIIAV